MTKNITIDELKQMTSDGLVLQGCGGPAEDWLEGINEMLTEERILHDGEAFKDIYVFDCNGVTNILYPFDGLNPDNLDMGKLAMWRLQNHANFGGTWLSDYLPNQLGVEFGQHMDEITVTAPDCEWTIKADYVYQDASGQRLSETVYYPADAETIKQLSEKVTLNSVQSGMFYIETMESVIPRLENVLPDTVGFDEINELAIKIRDMDAQGRDKFITVLDKKGQYNTVDAVINLTNYLDNPAAHLPIQVYIENVQDESIGGFTIPLPAKLEELKYFLETSAISGWQDTEILQIRSNITGLETALKENLRGTISPIMTDELNYLAVKISGLNKYEIEVFTSALEAKRHCGSIAEIINLTENLDCFYIQPAFSAEQYGEFMLEMEKDNTATVFDKLDHSQYSDERDLAKYILLLENHVDKAAYGRTAAEKEGGIFTENGYLTETGSFKEVYRGTTDIPDEYRIFTKPGEIYKQPIKLNDVDVAETIVKIHALCCGNIFGAADGLKAIMQGHNKDFILMVNKDRTFVTPTDELYKHGEIPEKTVDLWAKMPETAFYALRVTERDDDNARNMKGNFIELNTKALLSNMERHAVMPDRIEAFKHDGYSKSYDSVAWAALSASQQSEVKSVTAHFPKNELDNSASFCASFMNANEWSCESVGADAFLSAVNAVFMADAENPQPDMLRITNEAAKEILAGGNADVFKLTPDGPTKLAQIEAARHMCFAEHADLAIRCEDSAALDKWARRTADKIIRQNERDEHKKSRNAEI